MVRLLVSIIALGLVAWLITFLPLPAPFPQIIWVLIILMLIWLVLATFGVISSPSWWKAGPLILLLMPNGVMAQDVTPTTIVNWHMLKSTSDYQKQLNSLKKGDHLIVWVGYTDLALYAKLQNSAQHCYVESLPGIPRGIIIGNDNHKMVAEYGILTLSDSKIESVILDKLKPKVTFNLQPVKVRTVCTKSGCYTVESP